MAKTYVFTGKGDGTFTSGPPLIRPTVDWSTPYLASTVDVDGDGSMDVIIPHGPSNSAYVFFGKRDGTFEDPVPVPAGRRPMSVAAADFDGDGRTDLVFASAVSGTVTILKTSPGLAATAAVTPQPAARSDPVRRAPGMPHPWWMETVPR